MSERRTEFQREGVAVAAVYSGTLGVLRWRYPVISSLGLFDVGYEDVMNLG